MSGSPTDRIQSVQAAVYRVPTATGGRERPESDGTLEWDHTDMLVGDGLHPSAAMYRRWLEAILPPASAALASR